MSGRDEEAPFFSVIITVFNRERLVERCLDSLLAQTFRNWEAIIVDDASTDESVRRIRRYEDPRMKLICHTVNQGMQPARDTGSEAATGKWRVILDSDDELSDAGAMQRMYERMRDLPPDVMATAFASRMDDGQLSPWNPQDEMRDYVGWLRFMEERLPYGRPTAALDCLRRDCPPLDLGIAEGKGYEDLFMLEFHKQFSGYRTFADVCRLYHQDADNQLTRAAMRDPERDRRLALDRLTVLETSIERHGPAMAENAPLSYWLLMTRIAALHFSVGERSSGMRYSLRAIQAKPFKPRSWGVPLFGVIGKKALQKVRHTVQHWHGATA